MRVRIYDATLTEGTRAAGIHFSSRDKLRIALRLGELGVAWIEAGWPGRPGEDEVFQAARGLTTGEARLCACADVPVRGRPGSGLAAAIRSGAPAVTLFASAWGRRPGGGAGVARAISTAVRRVRAAGREALVDLGDFFDAHRDAPVPAIAAVAAAARAGAEAVLLSDTLGGALPGEVEAGVAAARRAAGRAPVGVRARNDAGLAVASSLAAVTRGATVVAGTINGYGERCGAADLVAVISGLELKLGRRAVREGQLKHLAGLAHFVAELADRQPPRGQPYVGRDAFPEASEEGKGKALHHVDPGAVGNRPEPAMSDARGHPRALWLARELGLVPRGAGGATRVVKKLTEWERRGYRYEGAEASFDLVLRELAGRRKSYFRVLAHRVLDHMPPDGRGFTEATVDLAVGGETVHAVALGVGPVHALDQAMHRALEPRYPELKEVRVVDARSRNLPGQAGSEAAARVLVETTDGRDYWGTAGVSENLLEAVTQAIADAIEYKLVKDDVAPPARRRKPRR